MSLPKSMKSRSVGKKLLIFAWLASTQGAVAGHEPYQVVLANTCSQEIQQELNHAVTLLHSFEYPETGRLFAELISRDPKCAMARWGAAMSLWHPLWAPPGEQALHEGAALLSGTDALMKSDREQGYINALKAFFSNTDISAHKVRASAYEAEMQQVYLANLDDPEAAVFYALALLATQDPRDKTYAHQFKAAGLLNWVAESHPGHPGVMHYLIHSYDFPGMAHLALKVAKSYAAAAPDSAHAQHMPSHIFTRLGLWDLSIASNHDSTRSAAEYTRRANLTGHYDEGLHSIDYLMYALLQTARDEQARSLLQRLVTIKKTEPENFKVAFTYAASPARYALERRAWKEASQLELLRPDFAWQDFKWALSIHHFARGIGSARMGQIEQAKVELSVLEKLRDDLPGETLPYWREEVHVHIDSVSSWIRLAEGNTPEALMFAKAAADREDGVDKHPVTPGEVLPAAELYADMLFETGQFELALRQYEEVLAGSPGRLNALVGAANSANKSRNDAKALLYGESVRQQTRAGEARHHILEFNIN